MLFPTAVRFDEETRSTVGTMVYRLYDLRDGSAIFQNEATFTVNVTEDPAVTILFVLLTGAAREDVEKYFLTVK